MSNRLFITGDKHGSLELKKISRRNFPLMKELSGDRSNIIAITGDAGFMWDNTNETRWWDDWTEDLGVTVISCYGNHSNYDAIRALPTEEWNGGIVRKVRPHVMYLENGEIFNICEHTIFVQGGAASIDKIYRKEGKSWWSDEIPSFNELQYAANNLEKINFKTDIIISHTAPNSMINIIDKYYPKYDDVTNFLEKFILSQAIYNNWFCGHFHIDRTIPNRNFHFLYNDIIELLPDNTIKVVNN